MSKQEESKAAQGYTTAVKNCGNCAQLTSELALPAWMIRDNVAREAAGIAPYYTLERHGEEKNFRCGIGGFAVKKTATCVKHTPK